MSTTAKSTMFMSALAGWIRSMCTACVSFMSWMPSTGGPTAEDAFRAVEFVDACYRSAAGDGAPVRLVP